MRHSGSEAHESDPDNELPPFDGDEELGEEEPGISIDPETLLTTFDDEEGLDDELAQDLDVGIELDAPPEDAGETGGELVLDIATLLNLAEDEPEPDEADETGPVDFDASAGIQAPPGESLAGPPEEGTGEPFEDLVSGDLPELDADSEGDYDGEDAAWLEIPDTRDDEPPPWAEEHWRNADHVPGALSALARAGGELVAGGEDLLWWSAKSASPERLGADTGIESLALVGPAFDAVLLATTDHRLLRRFKSAREPQLVAGWSRVVGSSHLGPPRIELCQCTGDATEVVLARTSTGRLARSDDGGETWSSVDVRARVIAISPSGAPLALLVEDRTGLSLLSSADTGLSWNLQPLDEAGRRVAGGTAPILGVCGSVVCVGDSARGLAVSTDGGASFSHVDGCAGVEALTAGELDGQVRVWAALYDEPNDHTELVLVDPALATAERIAEIETAGLDDEPGHERARVAAIAWDPDRRRLWAAGMGGLRSWAPPDSEGSDGTGS